HRMALGRWPNGKTRRPRGLASALHGRRVRRRLCIPSRRRSQRTLVAVARKLSRSSRDLSSLAPAGLRRESRGIAALYVAHRLGDLSRVTSAHTSRFTTVNG